MTRTHTKTAPEWCACEVCGSYDVEQTTFSDCPDDYAFDGDDIRGKECGLEGSISVYEGGDTDVVWLDDEDMAAVHGAGGYK